MSLDSIVNVTIDAQTTTPSQTGFGVPLLAGYHTHFNERVRFYTSLTGMVSDGFTTSEGIYKAASAIFSQNPHPTRIAVGRFTTASTQTVRLSPTTLSNSTLYTVSINDEDLSFTSDASATLAEWTAGMTAAINASTQLFTATDASTYVSVAANAAGTIFFYEDVTGNIDFQDVTTDGSSIAAQLAAISLENDEWYCLVLPSAGKAEILAAAAYIETVKKIFIANSMDADIIGSGSGDLASDLEALSYARSALIWHKQSGQHAGAAWAGVMLPTDPGSATWKFKTLAGVSVDTLTETHQTNLTNKKANYYIEIADIGITSEGVTSSGEFIDVTVFVDWLQARMQERIFGILVNLPKLPFTDAGIAVVENAIRGQLKEGITVGGLVDGSEQVIVPKAIDISAAGKAARRLTGVTFQAQLAGAIHSLEIQGTVTL